MPRGKRTPAKTLIQKRLLADKKARVAKYTEHELARYREARGIETLAKKLKPREVKALRKAFLHLETREAARKIFIKIAKKYGVTSGALDQALAVKLGKRVTWPFEEKPKLKLDEQKS